MSGAKVNKTILFGCWNLGGCDIDVKHNALSKVIHHIKSNNPEGTIDNSIILGDNYYAPKDKYRGIKVFNRKHFESGMDCLEGLPGKNVYMLVGNHEVDTLIELDESIASASTKGGPFCSIEAQREYIRETKDTKISIMDDPVRGLHTPSTNLNADILFINTNVYKSLRSPPKPKKDKNKKAKATDKSKKAKDKSKKATDKSKSKKATDKSVSKATKPPKDIPDECAGEMSDKMKIIDDQNRMIIDIINSPKKNVIICGHEPLLNYRHKDMNIHEWHPQIIEVLSNIDPRDIDPDKSIYYICADTHLYQEFTLNFKNGLKVKQYTVGTRGTKLDDTAIPNEQPIYGAPIPLDLMCQFKEYPILHRSTAAHGYLVCENNKDGSLSFEFKNVTGEGLWEIVHADREAWSRGAARGYKRKHRKSRKSRKSRRKSRKSRRKHRKYARSKSTH
jgi:hypothetical protein